MRTQPIMAQPGEHLRAGFVYDARMPSFNGTRPGRGTWRVKWCCGGDPRPVGVYSSIGMQPELRMNVARLLKSGQACNPVKLAIEYNAWLRETTCQK